MSARRLDEIGYWSEVKLDIVREYATAYSVILNKQQNIRGYAYIDAFAGAGTHISKETGKMVAGSPLNALLVDPPFTKYHFIDLDGGRASKLRQMTKGMSRVEVLKEIATESFLKMFFLTTVSRIIGAHSAF